MKTKHLGVCFGILVFVMSVAQPAASQDKAPPIPTMAYYYIWFNTESWNRAKTDYPLLGRYSSDNREVMEQHIRMARESGIDGFIVSWKSTYALDERLEQLMSVANAENFDLWIIYQGLDFERQPLPVDLIISDLSYFTETYADHPAFAMYDRPVVILSGTWEFSASEISLISNNFRDSLYILGSERNVEGYLRIASVVDGNAYYWSSVDPLTFPGYEEKLTAMGEAVHDRRGIWVAPAAPGFDARLIGGTRIVERRDGQTLQLQLDAALRSGPDAIGVISWNEFSENTHIEPSENYGTVALDVVAGRQVSLPPSVIDFDSSAPGDTDPGRFYQVSILLGMFLMAVVSISVILVRHTVHRSRA